MAAEEALSRTGGSAPHLTFFDSVQAILRDFHLVTASGADGPYDVHLMLRDPADGSYHVYLGDPGSAASDVSEGDVANVAECVRRTQHLRRDALHQWIVDNTVEDVDGARALALDLVQGRSVRDHGRLAPSSRRNALGIVLSALPSQATWDVCGYYHTQFPERDLGATLWSFTGSDVPGSNGTIAAMDLDEEERRWRPLLGELDYQRFLVEHCGLDARERERYDEYHDIYDVLRGRLFPGVWDRFICRPVSVTQLFVGIVFATVPPSKSMAVANPDDLAKAAARFRVDVHRDLVPPIAGLWQSELDRRALANIGGRVNSSEVLQGFCRHINFLAPVEECLLEVPADGISLFWAWRGDTGFHAHEHGDLDVNDRRRIAQIRSAAGGGWLPDGLAAQRIEGDLDDTHYRIHLVTRELKALQGEHAEYHRRFLTTREQTIRHRLHALVLAAHALNRQRARGVESARAGFGHEIRKVAQAVGQGWLLRPQRAVEELAWLPYGWRIVPFPELLESARILLALWANPKASVAALFDDPSFAVVSFRCWEVALSRVTAVVCAKASFDDDATVRATLDGVTEDLRLLQEFWTAEKWVSVVIQNKDTVDPRWHEAMRKYSEWATNFCRLLVCVFDDFIRHAHPFRPFKIEVGVPDSDPPVVHIFVEDFEGKNDDVDHWDDTNPRLDRILTAIHNVESTGQGAGVIERLVFEELRGTLSRVYTGGQFRLQIRVPFPAYEGKGR